MLDRKQSPTNFNFSIPEIPKPEIILLSNGLRIHPFHNPSVGILKAEFIFKSANVLNESLNGLNLLTAKTLLSGTKKYSSQQIANKIASLGAFVEVSPSFDYTILNVYCLPEDIQKVIELVNHILNEASFPEDEVELQKSIIATNLKTQEKKNHIKASKRLRQLIYNGHAYGRILDNQSLNALNKESIVKHFTYFRSKVEIILSGNITKPIVDAFNHISSFNQSIKPGIDPTKILKKRQNTSNLKIADSIQTSIRIGKQIINKSNASYPKLVLANYILGGFFGSRLMNNLREEKGLTYGVYSSLTSLRYSSYFSIGCDVKSSDTELAIAEIRKEIDLIQTDTVKIDEFNAAKNHYLGSFQNSLSSVFSLSDKYKAQYLYDLDTDFYSNLISSILLLKPEDIQITAQDYFKNTEMILVTVGG